MLLHTARTRQTDTENIYQIKSNQIKKPLLVGMNIVQHYVIYDNLFYKVKNKE